MVLLIRKYQLITNVVQNFIRQIIEEKKLNRRTKKLFCCFQLLNTENIKKRIYQERNEHRLTCLNQSNKRNGNKRSNEQEH